jgi:hypothetical protein
MASHKFTYVVSGVDLTSEQKAAISREIGSAVARALAGASPKPVTTDFLCLTKIAGGIWIDPSVVAREPIGEFVAQAEG